ncbi:MCE family protein [Nocardia brasiliensis]|uniref:MCE family protein n=1 Tax=Nocardia brasiliensis TaxID=37326 RepID=A0A6G9XTI0_NOCBR|nr:MlaD family protein [Nocardia brasiliensis]QIS04234.1 MCE family protein [Nocardia brasiliensis]
MTPRLRSWTTALVITAAALTGCSYNPAKLALLDRHAAPGYSITVEFDNALNLPIGARLVLDGAAIGTVVAIGLTETVVAVRADIDDGVRIPADSTATITQDTVLGDPYVKLDRPQQDSGIVLAAGARIDAAHTTAATSLEDTLAALSNFFGSGSLAQLQRAVARLDTALPPSLDDVRGLAEVLATDIRSLAGGTAQLDQTLADASATVTAIDRRTADIVATFTPEAMRMWGNLRILLGHIGVLLPSVGSVYNGGYWLVPMIDSLAGTVETVGGAAGTAAALDRFLRTTLLPLSRDPKVEVTSLVTDDGTEHIDAVADLLRMLGAVR